mgnify:CR=1 FL=1
MRIGVTSQNWVSLRSASFISRLMLLQPLREASFAGDDEI